MKKIYIKPLATCVTLNISGSIMEAPMLSGSQSTAPDDPEGGNKHEEYLPSGGNTGDGGGLPWGGNAKQHSAWDTWDD